MKEKVYRSPHASQYIPTNVSLSQFILRDHPGGKPRDETVLEDDCTTRSLTRSELRRDAARHAWVVRERYGVKPGDVVAISAPNSVAHVQLLHTILWTGATICLINHLSTKDDFEHYFSISQPSLLFVDSSLLQIVRSVVDTSHPHLTKRIITLAGAKDGYIDYPSDFTSTSELSIFDLSSSDNREHTAAICFSSGTSGKPKGVELSHHNLIASLICVRSTDPGFHNSASRTVFFAPLCHIYGLFTVALMCVWTGSYTMLMKKFTLDAYLDLSSRCKANNLRIVPSIALAMAKHKDLDKYDLSSVRSIMCTGAALPSEVSSALDAKMNGAPIFQGYGMTETNITALLSDEGHKNESVGRLYANMEARIVDDNMNDVPKGYDGELLVRGPSVFRRYLNDPTATSQTFHNTWFRTGDVLNIDLAGYLYLTGRKKELIKYKGFQVAPSELEGILTSHVMVEEAAVCAKWDEEMGTEVPLGFVRLRKDGSSSSRERAGVIDEIREFVDSRVASYKKLRGGVVVVDEMPKTASGKVLKRVLQERLGVRGRAKL